MLIEIFGDDDDDDKPLSAQPQPQPASGMFFFFVLLFVAFLSIRVFGFLAFWPLPFF